MDNSALIIIFGILMLIVISGVIKAKPSFGFFSEKINPVYESILIKYSRFYRQLPPKSRRKFNSRLENFIENKNFETRENLERTEEMVVLISAAAIKLTFGLGDYLFESFPTIIIYPDKYYSKASKTFNKGETNPRGVIVFSWADFLEGDKYDNDNINLGLHEFAHALTLEYMFLEGDPSIHEDWYVHNIPADTKSFFDECKFKSHFEEWRDYMKNNFQKLKEMHIFRKYAFTNFMEMFSVCIENFFETPDNLKKELPELYGILCKLLNQDPLFLYNRTPEPQAYQE